MAKKVSTTDKLVKAKRILYDIVSIQQPCLQNLNQVSHFRYNTYFQNSIITSTSRSKNKQYTRKLGREHKWNNEQNNHDNIIC